MASTGYKPYGSTTWSNELDSCWSAYWLCDCSPDCCLAYDASCAVLRPTAQNVGLLGELSRAAGITDICALFCMGMCQLFPGAGAIARSCVRAEVRQLKGIDGDEITDCLTHCFCGPCAVYQEARELNLRGVVSQQPSAMRA